MKPFRYCPHCATELSVRHDGERERLSCAACGFVHYDNPTPVVAAVVEHEGRVILVRNQGWPEKWFGLVTGFLERGETAEAGILRELDEELGLRGTVVEMLGVYPFALMNQLIVAYHVRAEGEIRLGAELADFRAIEPAKLRPWPGGTGDALREWMRRNVEGHS
ncbi:MAG: NUDIX domain-containing protein [Myxococcales bacterium]|nr:NUDIX domain-containing protein [Myxococcales bacterium]